MKSVEEIAIDTYQNNLNYFAREHKDLHSLINSFGKMLDEGIHPEAYDLEYINEYFDIKELATNKYIYNEDSSAFSKKLADEISFKKNEAVFNNINIKKSSQEFLATLSDKTRGQKSIYELNNYCLDNTSKDDLMNKIEKFIFIGVGLGQHIELVHNKIKSSEYLIIEDNLEFFRLSLFVTKYFEIGKNAKIHFSIAEDDNMFINSMQKFMGSNFVYNKQFKYLHLKTHSRDKIKRIQNAIVAQDFLTFPYGILIEKHLRALEFVNTGYNILDLTEHFTDKLLTTIPVLLLAAGPSFEKNIEWIKENHTKYVIVAVSAVLKRLYELGIKPDIVTHSDGFSASTGYYMGFDVKEFLKDTIFIFEAFTPTNIRKMFPKKNIFQFEGDTYYSNKKRSISTPCIGSLSLFISLFLNVKELYILGLDLAIDQETGKTHSDKHFYSDDTEIENKDNFSNTASLRNIFIPVEGNLQEIVYTIPLFYSSIQAIHNDIVNIKTDEQQIYNLGEGVKLKEVEGLEKKDINRKYVKLDKKDIYSALHRILLSHSIQKIDSSSADLFNKRYQYILNVKQHLDNCFRNISYIDPDKYMNSLVQLLMSISQDESLESMNIREVYYKYYLYMLPIVVDFFNTRGLGNKKRHIKKIDVIVKKELYRIQNTYEEVIGDFIENQYMNYTEVFSKIIKEQENARYTSYSEFTNSMELFFSTLYEGEIVGNSNMRKMLNELHKSIELPPEKTTSENNSVSKINSLVCEEVIKILTMNNIPINKYRFVENLKQTSHEQIIYENPKEKTIGFLAVEDQLDNQDFVNYIKMLCKKLPETRFILLYFSETEKEKILQKFSNEVDQITLVVPNDISLLINSITLFISYQFEESKVYKTINKNIDDRLHGLFKSVAFRTSRQTRNSLKQYRLNEIYEYKNYKIENFLEDSTCNTIVDVNSNAFDFMRGTYVELLIKCEGFLDYINDISNKDSK